MTCATCELHAESTFRVEGMDCRDEVAMLERRFKHLPGIEKFSADLMGRRLHVTYDAAKLSTSAIAGAVADAGMRAWLEHEEPIDVGGEAARWRRTLVWTSGTAFAAGLVVDAFAGTTGWARVLYGTAVASGGTLFLRKAWQAAKVRALDINVLMLIAAAGAMILGQWSEAAAVVFLFALAQALEARTLERARHQIRSLVGLTPTDALVRDVDQERRVPVDLVTPGMVMIVRPGEKIALDGVVVAGESDVNQAPVTGESLPADKAPGAEVFAGTINGRGALEVRVTRVWRDTTLARVIHLVERAQAQRAPAQAFIERFARVYTPAVIILALVLAVGPPLVTGAAWTVWIYRALVLLVVSCPCALVISTPVSIVAALSGAARKGVLIKGGVHLERTSGVRCIAFDKTGTLTRGTPEVVDVIALNGVMPRAIVELAASVEQRSAHPIAQAILRYADACGVAVIAAGQSRALTGRGAEGRVGGTHVVLGNHRLFAERRLASPSVDAVLDDLETRGRTPVIVAKNEEIVGIIAVADTSREAGRDTVRLLHQQGIESVVLLTGDSYGTASAIAKELGVDEFRAELLPEGKVAALEELRRRYGAVAMVGDGINDAPALAAADVGIVMGAAGSDASLETADVALMADELLKIPYAVRLSRATMRNIKANLVISLAMKAVFVVLAVAGMASLWMAVVADTGASIVVIANALRLLRAE